MRIIWMLAGVGGLSAATASASATLNWQTVLGPNSQIDGSGTLTEVDSVVISPTGDVGVIGKFAPTPSSGTESAVLFVPFSISNSPPVTVVAAAGDTYTDAQQSVVYPLDNFDNLTITGNTALGTGTRLTFVSNGGPTAIGIFQYDVGGSGIQPVAFNNDIYNGTTLMNQSSLSGTLAMQVNQEGQVFFATGTASNTVNVLVSGNSSSNPTATIAFKDGDQSLTLSGVSNRVGISGDLAGNGVATLTNASSVQGIYAVSGNQANLLSGAYINPSLLATSSGVTGVNGVSASVFLAGDPTVAGQTDVVLNQHGNLLSSGTNTTIFTGPSGGGSPNFATAEITPDGKQIAAFVQDSNGGTLQYYNAGAASPAAVTIASTIGAHALAYDPATNHTDAITSLQNAINAPMINSKGTVIFDAMVDTDAVPSGTQALLEWQPNDANPIILLAVGDTVNIDGAGPQVIEFININGLDTENDFFKNSLNDNDDLAVSVLYGDQDDPAVIMTSLDAVPEPTTACILPLAGAALIARRRRRTSRR